jgi:hypothetical protein
MKDRIKAHYYAFKHDPFSQGIFVGGMVGIGTMTIASHLMKVNYDTKGLYIPDHLISTMRETKDMIIAHKQNANIVLALVPEV